MAFIQTEIKAEDVLDAMNEDGGFALELWEGLAERLNMGLLEDQLSDLLQSAGPQRLCQSSVVSQFEIEQNA